MSVRRGWVALAVISALLAGGLQPAVAGPPRIVGGAAASIEDHPWQVAILTAGIVDGYSAQFCGGTLIEPRFVLTAAHCVTTGTTPSLASSIVVGTGVTTLSEITPADRTAVVALTVHPGWDPSTNENDVAVLELAAAPPGATAIELFRDTAGPAAGTDALISGWGDTTGGADYADGLRAATVDVLAGPTDATCGSYGAGYVAALMLCGGVTGGGIDTCQGDSGGPLTVLDGSERKIAGVTSFGVGCAQASHPGVYARVSAFASWIDEQTGGGPGVDVRVPSAPQSVVVRTVAETIEVSWAAPGTDGGATISDYVIRYRRPGGEWTTYADGAGTGTSTVLTGLRPKGNWEVEVAALNSVGTGAYSATASASFTRPGAVRRLEGVGEPRSITLSWRKPRDLGGGVLRDYVIQIRRLAAPRWRVLDDGVGTRRSVAVTDLSNNIMYEFRVAAKTAAGRGPWTEVTVTAGG